MQLTKVDGSTNRWSVVALGKRILNSITINHRRLKHQRCKIDQNQHQQPYLLGSLGWPVNTVFELFYYRMNEFVWCDVFWNKFSLNDAIADLELDKRHFLLVQKESMII